MTLLFLQNCGYFTSILEIRGENLDKILTIYAPINFMAPCIIFSGTFFSLRGGLGPGTRDFFGAREIARAVRRVRFGAQKRHEFQGPKIYWCIGSFMYTSP